MSEVLEASHPRKYRGRRECRMRVAPVAACAAKKHRRQQPQVHRISRRVQTVVATLIVFTDDSSSSSASAGVFQPSVFLGRALRAAATADMSSALWILRSEPFGKYCRSNPLVFSFVPRCQGLLGSQK